MSTGILASISSSFWLIGSLDRASALEAIYEAAKEAMPAIKKAAPDKTPEEVRKMAVAAVAPLLEALLENDET